MTCASSMRRTHRSHASHDVPGRSHSGHYCSPEEDPEQTRALMPGYSRSVYPEFGPDDTAAEAAALRSDFKSPFSLWYTGRLNSNYKEVVSG